MTKNEKTNDKIIYGAILIILIYSVGIALRHPMTWTLVTIIILPLLYILSAKIRDVRTKLMLTKILSIIYGIVSVLILVICLMSGFLENGTVNVAIKNIGTNSPLILGFLTLSTFVYKKQK